MVLSFLPSDFGGLGGGRLLAEGSTLEEQESAPVGDVSFPIVVLSASTFAVVTKSLLPFVKFEGSVKRRVDGNGRLVGKETANRCGVPIDDVGVVNIVF